MIAYGSGTLRWPRLLAAIVVGVIGATLAYPIWASSPQTAVEWLLPAALEHPVQTSAQDEAGKRVGRPLPRPELLQPSLDSTLPLFVPADGANLQGAFVVAASDTLPGLVHQWIRAFNKFYPDVQIAFSPPYEGTQAAKGLDAGTVNIAFVSRELKPLTVAAFRSRHGYTPLSVPVSGGSYRHFGFLDAIVFFVNRKNPIAKLSLAQLDAAISRSPLRGMPAAKTWGELGATGTWAKRPIHVYAIKPWNGFEEFVRQRVLSVDGQRGHWRTDIHFDKTVFPIAKRVAADPDGIGYAGLSFVDAPVKILSIGSSGHYIAPTYTNVASATYPLSRLIYANVNRRPGTRLPVPIEEFLRFVLSRQGQQIVLDQAVFLPLRGFQVKQARGLIAAPAKSASR